MHASSSKRSRSNNTGADAGASLDPSKRQKSLASNKTLSGLERVVSLGTVLQCVDTRADKEGSFDAAVGQPPATVHEVTQGRRVMLREWPLSSTRVVSGCTGTASF